MENKVNDSYLTRLRTLQAEGHASGAEITAFKEEVN